MSRGWDEAGWLVDESTWRMSCGIGLRPNVFCGLCPGDDSPPAVAGGLGVSDIALEYWHCWKIISSIATAMGDTTGLWLTVAGALAGFNMRLNPAWVGAPWSPTAISSGLDPDTGVPPAVTTMANIEIPLGWSYVAVNFDRSGNMDTYVNGQLADSTAIVAMVAENFENSRFYAKTVYDDDPANYNGTLEDLTTYHAGRYIVGPTALHSRLMTVAEIQASYRGKAVQNFGAAGTVVCWYWQDTERLDGDPITWDFVENHAHHSTLVGLQDRGIGMPRGAAGTIRVPDRSGNGNHWVLPTLATYQRTAALTELASAAFLYDSFWAS